ncbi:E3 ubiquitin-protein ligase UBR3 [Eumeta japonica]|uniref:E3 ubiquitin-protein ligase n=1 Tax=Eumeta variegata TaxID=151549 RepID=A0A4C1U5R7_EUMVA|nr:E3 ubiquitin-protein ligase UBR3 [Eumeta japonica]
MTYIQANFCNSMVDMDIYWLQVCAAHLPADQFMEMCIDMFGVREWLSMAPMSPTQAAEQDAMVEGLLTFLAILVSSRTNFGNDELTQSRLEVSTLLAAGDKTHSQLLELMPERSGNAHTRNFETVLKELSTYRAPPRGSENLEQGLFVPRPEVWERYYDPLHVLRRAVHRRDFHASMERFTAYIREKQKSEGASNGGGTSQGGGAGVGPAGGAEGGANNTPPALWPPLRPAIPPPDGAGDPRTICASGVLQGALLAVLHRGVHHRRGLDAPPPHAPPDHVLALAVYLLQVGADLAAERAAVHTQNEVCVPMGSSGGTTSSSTGKPLLSTFVGRSLCDNARTVVGSVPAPAPHSQQQQQNQYPAHYHSDSDTEWEPSVSEVGRLPAPDSEAETEAVPSAAPHTSLAVAIPSPMQMVRGDVETDDQSDAGGDAPTIRALEDVESDSLALALPTLLNTTLEPASDTHLTVAVRQNASVVTSGRNFHTEGRERDEWSVSLGTRTVARALTPALPAANNIEDSNEENCIMVNESIISLLLKLHSQLSGRLDSFSLAEATPEPQPGPSSPPHQVHHARIGDGPYFIGGVLRKLARLDARCAAAIEHVRQTLWPHQRERQAEQRARERREKEERSRRARERQQQLMREFARRQQQFMSAMQQLEAEEGAAMDWEEEEPLEKEYHCVICNTISPTTTHNPLGLVVLLQYTLLELELQRLLAPDLPSNCSSLNYLKCSHSDYEAPKSPVSVFFVTTSPCRDWSTSVLGHRRRADSAGARLALSEAERARLSAQHENTAAAHHDRHHEQLQEHFDQCSWLLSVSVGWEGGVHVQSCGHHLHLGCLQSYLRSLAAPQYPHNLHVERGEFLCPVCRQLANCVLPLAPPPQRAPPPPRLLTGKRHDFRMLAEQIQHMLDKDHPPPAASRLSEAMGKAMEDMTATAGDKLRQRYGSSSAAIFTFVASLARTSLECELVQRGGALASPPADRPPRYKPRNDCIGLLSLEAVKNQTSKPTQSKDTAVYAANFRHMQGNQNLQGASRELRILKFEPLLVVLGAHARALVAAGAQLGAAETWRELCPPCDTAPVLAGAASPPVPAPHSSARPVPLLLRDPLALLMHFLLLAPNDPPYIDIQYFTCMVRALYALNYYQIVVQMCATSSAEGRAALAGPDRPGEPRGIRTAARTVLGALAGSDLFTEDGPLPPYHRLPHTDIAELELQLQELLLPLLRVSALLRHHLYGSDLPEVHAPRQEFVRLAYYLELVTEGMDWSEWSAWRALPPAGAIPAARTWARGLAHAAKQSQLAMRNSLSTLHVPWTQPALLALPRDYDRLFTYYHERVCQQCGAVPKEASVCLLCGTLVCLKQSCCRQQEVCEAVRHATHCGGGTGIFLVVTSTYIIVIRGRRACLWGSLYLDDYDEEDRDLKRGKPLYLSQDRLELLQAQWLAHRFDHTKRTWVWHRDSL